MRREVAPGHIQRRRAGLFRAGVVFAAAGFVTLAVVAHFVPYFSTDLAVTRFVQRIHAPAFEALMRAVSWVGFPPQVHFVCGLAMVALFACGLRWEAVATGFAELGILVGGCMKLLVLRPRPTTDLVLVLRPIGATSFPSGHVLFATTLCGFLAYLAYTRMPPSWVRSAVVALLVATIPLMGLSRIYLGHHWLSDVLGGYLLGSLWLALTIRVDRWGKARFFVHPPVDAAPARPRA